MGLKDGEWINIHFRFVFIWVSSETAFNTMQVKICTSICHLCLVCMLSGWYFSGKSGNLREFDSCQENGREKFCQECLIFLSGKEFDSAWRVVTLCLRRLIFFVSTCLRCCYYLSTVFLEWWNLCCVEILCIGFFTFTFMLTFKIFFAIDSYL